MTRNLTRVGAALAAGTALSMLGLSMLGLSGLGISAASASGTAGRGTAHPPTAPGTPLWVQRYSSPANGPDQASTVVVGPNGREVFVTGDSSAPASGSDYATVAYNAGTGARLWVTRYSGSSDGIEIATSAVVSPNGKTVYVTGYSTVAVSGGDYATVAYDAATGAQEWVARYNGPGNSDDLAAAVTVGAGGRTVYVTGSSFSSSGWAYATVAYAAATGAQLWAVRHTTHGSDVAHSLAVNPRGGTVYVTGSSDTGTATDYLTVAYNTATGAQRWARDYNRPGGFSIASSMTVSPSGQTVFVTGNSRGAASGEDYATVAYNAATGAQRWARRYNGPHNDDDEAAAVAVSSGKVFVTGSSEEGRANGEDYATVAYNAATGARLWVTRYNGPARLDDEASSVAVSPAGRTVYVTGFSGVAISGRENAVLLSDYATVAYSAATGTRLWVTRYNGPARLDDEASSVAVTRTGSRVFVTGFSDGTTTSADYATIAYRG
jgi:PQQ-like domain